MLQPQTQLETAFKDFTEHAALDTYNKFLAGREHLHQTFMVDNTN